MSNQWGSGMHRGMGGGVGEQQGSNPFPLPVVPPPPPGMIGSTPGGGPCAGGAGTGETWGTGGSGSGERGERDGPSRLNSERVPGVGDEPSHALPPPPPLSSMPRRPGPEMAEREPPPPPLPGRGDPMGSYPTPVPAPQTGAVQQGAGNYRGPVGQPGPQIQHHAGYPGPSAQQPPPPGAPRPGL